MSSLERLLAATPWPPDGEAEQLLATFTDMMLRRSAILAEGAPSGERAVFDELRRRDEAWLARLETAAQGVGGQRQAAGKLRAYR